MTNVKYNRQLYLFLLCVSISEKSFATVIKYSPTIETAAKQWRAIQGFSLALENPCDSTRDVRKLNKKLASPDFRNALVRIIILGYLN